MKKIITSSLFAIAMMATGSMAGQVENDIDMTVTSYPYNTDAAGNDLPMEIVTFAVPIQRNNDQSDTNIDLRYIRYLARDQSSARQLIFISDEDTDQNFWLPFYSMLTAFADVIVFDRRGHGLSSIPYVCPQRLNYPLDEPLERAKLTRITRHHFEECASVLATKGFSSALNYRESALDLLDLARTRDATTITLIAENRNALTAWKAVRLFADRIDRVIFIDPEGLRPVTEGQLITTLLNPATEPAGQQILRRYRALDADLKVAPIRTSVTTTSNRVLEIAIGHLDLTMMTARLVRKESNWRIELSETLEAATKGKYDLLAQLVLETRQWLSTPNWNEATPQADNDCVDVDNVGSDLTYSLNWPAIVEMEPRTDGCRMNTGTVNTRSPYVVVVATDRGINATPQVLRSIAEKVSADQVVRLRSNMPRKHQPQLFEALLPLLESE